ncbi:hypothetical protein KY289_003881 [Solanum tuberosum]|nr:hypothetical protein KY289_003881 [Solanum tuberosum]
MSIEIQPSWKIHFDGAAHHGGASVGMVFITSQEEILPFSFTLTQCCSNNIAEYQGLILNDLINQLLGSYEVKKPELPPYHDYSQKLIGWLGDVTLQHVPISENKKLDVLAALASTLTLPDQTLVTICQKCIVSPPNEDEYTELEYLIAVSEAAKEYWRQHIIDYMCYGILPENPRRKTDIRCRAPHFLYYKDTLYRKSFEGILLRCLGAEESIQALQEAHSEVCGSHQSGSKHTHLYSSRFLGLGPINAFIAELHIPSSSWLFP